MSQHDAINALPTAGNANHALIRDLLTKRMAYCLDTSEAATSFTAVDPADGTLPLYIIQSGTVFRFDSTDTTTANDGVTCLVTADGKRYKTLNVAFPYAVLSVAVSAEPVSPTIGDAYLLPTGSTGTHWAGNDGKIGIFTARGWVFVVAGIGQQLYNEANDSYYHKNASGTWILGFGTQTLGTGAVFPYNMHGGGGKVRFYIENQTTNTPPVSPPDAVEYIVGPSPTGAWAGQAGKIAREEAGAWAFYAPAAGWRAFDKAQAAEFIYSGSVWQTGGGNMKRVDHYFTTAGAFTFNKDARSVFVDVLVVGGAGGGNSTINVNSTAGGTSSFGSHCSATGGGAANGSGVNTVGASGAGSGGDFNGGGVLGYEAQDSVPSAKTAASFTPTEFGPGPRGGVSVNTNIALGGPGGFSRMNLLSTAIGSSETVTVGAAGGAGSGGVAGQAGFVVVREWILT